MRKTMYHQAIQKTYAGEVEPPRPLHWDQYDRAIASVTSFEGPGERLVATRARAGAACGGFWGEMVAVWVARPRGEWFVLQLASDPRLGDARLPEVAADTDGDGVPELVGPDQVWRKAGTTYRPALTLPIPDFDCPC